VHHNHKEVRKSESLQPLSTEYICRSRAQLQSYGARIVLVGLLMAVCAALAMGGCGKKIVKHGIPFGLDEVFRGGESLAKPNWKEKGIRLAKERNFAEAVEAFKQHVLEEPESFSGFNAIAVCYKNLVDHANAMKNFERALEFADSPEETAKILANIGNLYFAANRPQVALRYYKDATELFGKNPLYLIFIARTFILLKEYDRARKVLAMAEAIHKDLEKYERDEDKGLGSYLMTYCYLALNDENKVYYHIENALRANPERYVRRFEEDLNDSKSLLYTLKGDPRVEKALQTYSGRSTPVARRGEG
jgi:tetratricopeptide (TPR) repeat protein